MKSNGDSHVDPHQTPPATGAAPRGKSESSARARVMIVDDHPLLRQGLARLINEQPDLIVCGEAGNAPDALRELAAHRPELIILDLTLADSDGLDLCKQLHDQHPTLPVLVVTMHDESLYAERTLRAGAMGYVMKQEPQEVVMAAIRRVLSGEVFLSQKMSAKLLHALARSRSDANVAPLQRLSDRELEIFRLIGHGLGVRGIAEKLCLSPKTIEAHKEHIKAKLNLKSSSELLQYAIEARNAAI